MKIIYVSGPIRSGLGWEGVFQNIMRARAAARRLWRDGWAVICPHMNTMFMDGPDLPDSMFLDGDREIIRRVDAIYMLPGWSSSIGANLEHDEAERIGIEIIYGEIVS